MRLIRRTGRIVVSIVLALAVLLLALWGSLAIAFRAPFAPPTPMLIGAAWAVVCCVVAVTLLAGRRKVPLVVVALASAVLFGWWSTVTARGDRDWADDVARVAIARIEGSTLTVENVRNFIWRSDTDYTIRWETRRYDLSRLRGADLFLSYWAGENIAHAIVSFDFEGSEPLAFSIEIRKERGEDYSSIAGFFRSYEVAFIAADERDVVKVRSTVRGEDVRLYRLDMRQETALKLLKTYVGVADDVAQRPRWYNTVTTNCTTTIFRMARALDPGIPLDYRVLLSGLVPGYLYDHDFLVKDRPLEDLVRASRIGPRSPGPLEDPDFSARIRTGVPGPAWTKPPQSS
ncbi:MAG: DUF4105 domain-containing protein [Burkholderiales bacterium]|nr:DUF4105 domain-containing protein [Burkholderiales bacterium]